MLDSHPDGSLKCAKITLLRAERLSFSAIARRLKVCRRLVRTWLERFLTDGFQACPINPAVVASRDFPSIVSVSVGSGVPPMASKLIFIKKMKNVIKLLAHV